MAGTPWLTTLCRVANAALTKERNQAAVNLKGLFTSDAEERSEEEDSREMEEDDDETSKLVSQLTDFQLCLQLNKEIAHLPSLFQSQPLEILVPPPQV